MFYLYFSFFFSDLYLCLVINAYFYLKKFILCTQVCLWTFKLYSVDFFASSVSKSTLLIITAISCAFMFSRASPVSQTVLLGHCTRSFPYILGLAPQIPFKNWLVGIQVFVNHWMGNYPTMQWNVRQEKKNWTLDMGSHQTEPQNDYTEGEKSNTNEHIMWVSIYTNSWKRQNTHMVRKIRRYFPHSGSGARLAGMGENPLGWW